MALMMHLIRGNGFFSLYSFWVINEIREPPCDLGDGYTVLEKDPEQMMY